MNDSMKEVYSILNDLGLNKNEIDVYLTSLSLGETSASIIGKKISLNRSTAQYTCQSLVNKRIMHVYEKGNRYIYKSESPDKLKNIIKKKYQEIEKQSGRLNNIIDIISGMMIEKHSPLKIKYYNGIDGIIDITNDVLEENKTIYGIVNMKDIMRPELTEYLNKVYIPHRIKAQNKAFSIYNDNERSVNYRNADKKMNRVTLLLPEKDFPFDSCIHIYGDKVAFYSIEQNDISGLIIDNKRIRNTFFSIFKASWNYAKILPQNSIYKDLNL